PSVGSGPSRILGTCSSPRRSRCRSSWRAPGCHPKRGKRPARWEDNAMQNDVHILVPWPVLVVIGIIVLFMLGRHPHARPFVFGALGIAAVLAFFALMWSGAEKH